MATITGSLMTKLSHLLKLFHLLKEYLGKILVELNMQLLDFKQILNNKLTNKLDIKVTN